MKVEKFKAVHCHASQQSENQRNDPTKKMEKMEAEKVNGRNSFKESKQYGGGYNCDSTTIRLQFDGAATIRRPTITTAGLPVVGCCTARPK